jgi:hypothetical protein
MPATGASLASLNHVVFAERSRALRVPRIRFAHPLLVIGAGRESGRVKEEGTYPSGSGESSAR